MCLRSVLLCVVIIWHPGGGSVCPESKKLYPGDCRLFYKCVPVPESAQAYVWVPSRCTAGLVYEPRLQRCVLPGAGWDCEQTAALADSLYSLNRSGSLEDGTKMTDYSAASPVQGGSSASGFNDYDKSSKINFVSESPDSINAQMHRLTQLINKLKATSGPDHSDFPSKQETGLNPLPERIYKIMTLLISQTPNPNMDRTNLDLPKPQTKRPAISANYSWSEVVLGLFEKYLTNTTFLKDGQFVKPEGCASGERLPDLEDCRKYRVCEGGLWRESFCPREKAFSREKKVCDGEEFEKCKRSSVCLKEGSMAEPTNNKYYLICVKKDGKWVKRRVRCPEDLEYCVRKKICLSKAYCH